jgi:hypothetical protein
MTTRHTRLAVGLLLLLFVLFLMATTATGLAIHRNMLRPPSIGLDLGLFTLAATCQCPDKYGTYAGPPSPSYVVEALVFRPPARLYRISLLRIPLAEQVLNEPSTP